ncbi:unnamed protein product [Prorocentrum cordatum]|uniref:Choline transporter-like protein n=1 Tax=Prorocentrum cordatum TaxID=2364126 RepID=A0ABN9VWS7_9DINO|nr:unnamed protein product [Polarella glacialis]
MPKDPGLRAEARRMIGATSWSGEAIRVILALIKDWRVMVITSVYVIVLGYVFLFFLEHKECAKFIVHVFIAIEVLIPLYFAYQLGKELMLGTERHDAKYTSGDYQSDYIALSVHISLSCIFMIAGTILCGALDTSISCIEAAAECIFEAPSLLIEPIVGVLGKMIVLAWSSTLFIMLMSNSVREVDGFIDQFVFTTEQIIVTVFWVFLSVSLLWTLHHVSMYVLSYSAQMWYYRKKAIDSGDDAPVRRGALLSAYYSAVRYHLGSISLGSILSMAFGVLRGCMRVVEEGRDDIPCIRCVRALCGPCLSIRCYDRFLKYTGTEAYMDMAIHSYGFCDSARRVHDLFATKQMAGARAARNDMTGALQMFNFVALGGFVSSTMIVSYWLCTSGYSFLQVSDWKPMVCFSGIVSLIVGTNFLVILDCVGGMLFFTLATEQLRWRRENAEALDRVERVKEKLRLEEARGGILNAVGGWMFSTYEQLEDQEGRMHREVYTTTGMRRMLRRLGYYGEKGSGH